MKKRQPPRTYYTGRFYDTCDFCQWVGYGFCVKYRRPIKNTDCTRCGGWRGRQIKDTSEKPA